jgi:vacuolar-type H+-ATPase catalytic subunit A/Vma1
VQQEWLRDLLQDYTSQSMRMMGAWRGLTKNVMESAAESAADNIDRMQQGARDMTHQAENAVHHAQDMGHQAVQQTGEQVSNIADDMNSNYIQH